MPLIYCETCNTCPENSGLNEITARIIMNPTCTDTTANYTERTISMIPEHVFQTFVQDIVADPTKWSLRLIAETDFGRQLQQYSFNQLSIVDVVTSHSIQNPTEILLTIELAFHQVSTYSFSVRIVFNKQFEVGQCQISILTIRGTNIGFPWTCHSQVDSHFLKKVIIFRDF